MFSAYELLRFSGLCFGEPLLFVPLQLRFQFFDAAVECLDHIGLARFRTQHFFGQLHGDDDHDLIAFFSRFLPFHLEADGRRGILHALAVGGDLADFARHGGQFPAREAEVLLEVLDVHDRVRVRVREYPSSLLAELRGAGEVGNVVFAL